MFLLLVFKKETKTQIMFKYYVKLPSHAKIFLIDFIRSLAQKIIKFIVQVAIGLASRVEHHEKLTDHKPPYMDLKKHTKPTTIVKFFEFG